MIDTTPYFTEALDLREHPLSNAKCQKKVQYYLALSNATEYIVEKLKTQNVLEM